MHHSVLLQEVIQMLEIKEDDIVLDATFGGGGHAKAVAQILGPKGILIGIDTDSNAFKNQLGTELFETCSCTVHLKQANFRNLDDVLNELEIKKVDKFIFDLGFSSTQLQESGRGLSFQKDEPLLMTLSDIVTEETLTAKRIVNEWDEEHIATIIAGYSDESFAKRIAQAIVESRKMEEIKTTKQLKEIITQATPAWYQRRRIHPATKTFQALRIAVNDEIEALEEGLSKAKSFLNSSGRIAVITFHSIEDRVVKRIFKDWKKEGVGAQEPKKPVVPSHDEVKGNPRARSAKLRIFRFHPQMESRPEATNKKS